MTLRHMNVVLKKEKGSALLAHIKESESRHVRGMPVPVPNNTRNKHKQNSSEGAVTVAA
jgi:hypothetical protein